MKYIRGDIVFIHSQSVNKKTHVMWAQRPYLIVQNNNGNKYSPTTIVVPLSTKHKKMGMPTHVNLKWAGLRPSVILCEQVQVIDSTRCDLWDYKAHLPDSIMDVVDEALMSAVGIGGRCNGY